jgi:hypothetical protein
MEISRFERITVFSCVGTGLGLALIGPDSIGATDITGEYGSGYEPVVLWNCAGEGAAGTSPAAIERRLVIS